MALNAKTSTQLANGHPSPLITEQVDYNCVALQADLEDHLGKLNDCQKTAYSHIIASVNNGGLFFLSGSGGTGKTFVYNTICTKPRGDGKIILCVSSLGISALLLYGGWTAYSMFKFPIDGLDNHSVCAIPKNYDCAELMWAVTAIIWNKVGVQHWLVIEAIGCTLHDLHGSDWPFGDITVILGGDFL